MAVDVATDDTQLQTGAAAPAIAGGAHATVHAPHQTGKRRARETRELGV